VVLGYQIDTDINVENLPNEQYNQYAWFTKDELLVREDVHKHSKWYLDENAS